MVLTVADVNSYINRLEKTVKDPCKRALKKLEIAKLYREVKEYEDARCCAREYIKVKPNDYRAYNLLGAVSEDLHEWTEALKYYKRSIELQRSQKDILIKIVEMYSKFSLEDPEIARVWADKAAHFLQNHPAIFNLRWRLLTSTPEKNYDEIEDLLAEELMRNPKDAKLHIKLLELYMEKGDHKEAFSHCTSLLSSQLFEEDQELMMCSAQVLENICQSTNDKVEAVEALMKKVYVFCCLMAVTLNTSQLHLARDAFIRLDKAVGQACILDASSLPMHKQSEFEVFLAEARGQIYFHLAAVFFKMAQENEMSWAIATRNACACLAVSSSVKEPDTKAAWLHQKPSPDNQKLIWNSMACLRLCQTDHLILMFEKEHGEDWLSTSVADICSEAGKKELIDSVYGEMKVPEKSFLMMDKEFVTSSFELPDAEALVKYDEVAMIENPSNLNLAIWIGMNWHLVDNPVKTEALSFVSKMFEEIRFDVEELKNCSPFTLSSLDLEVFLKAVVYSAIDRLIFNDRENKAEFEPLTLPLSVSPLLCTGNQIDWWDAAFRLHTGKTWQVSTSRLKSVLQRGLESLRVIGNHGIEPAILKHISEAFFTKADEILNTRESEWANQVQLESFKKRGLLFGNEVLRILEINEGDRDIIQSKSPLIPPLLKPLDDKERAEMIDSVRMMLADAAFRDDLHSEALDFLNGLFTADAAYKQAQIFRDLASREDLKNVEGLRNHLSFLRKAREKLQTCLGRLDKAQMIFREGVESEIDEIREAISEQTGITSAPNKVLDLRYSSADEDEQEFFRGDEKDDPATSESKLALENSILHEQLAVRNHEFSVLAARIHKLEREMSEMRVNQSGNETIIKPRRDNSVNTDESSSSVAYVQKDDATSATSGSGNLTPRLEPEMSWDPFSPAPVFPVGFFSGLVDTVEKIEEETETELREASEMDGKPKQDSLDAERGSPNRSGRDLSRGEEDTSYGDNLHVEPLVQLTRKSELVTGEENEDIVYKEFAKLYRLHEGQWKERGIGDIKILKNKLTQKSRIVMRRDKVFIICANHLLAADMKLTKKQGSSTTFVWHTAADLSDESPTPETFAIRFKNEESAKTFALAFEKCQYQATPEESEVAGKAEIEEHSAVSDQKEIEKEKNAGFSFGGSNLSFSKVVETQKDEAVKVEPPKFSFKQGSAESSQEEKETTGENISKEPLAEENRSSSPKFNFQTSSGSQPTSGGFRFDPSKFKFEFGKGDAEADEDTDKEAMQSSVSENPFLAALQNSNASSSSHLSFNFGKPADRKENIALGGLSPFLERQDSPKASTPLTTTQFQLPKSAGFPLAGNVNTQEGQLGEFQASDYFNAAVQRGNQNASANQEMTTGQMTEQARFFQSDWEGMQDRYYEDAAYYGNDQYYDDGNFFENYDDYNDAEYYSGEAAYYGDEDAYYANGEGFEYYDQEPQVQLPRAESDSNSDRLSPQSNELTNQVPRVVQMIDDDIFVTFVKKASFANRAKAARLLLPATFFAPSSDPPCSGCKGCKEQKSAPVKFSKPESFWKPAPNAGENASFGTESKTDPTSKQNFLSFADLAVSSQETKPLFTGSAASKGFSGAGTVLFTSPKASENEDPDSFDPQFKPIVALEKKKELKTGEEGYIDLFKNRAKLFRFDFETKQWKERGIGEMKLSHNPETDYCRVLMRRDQVLKLCANHPIMPDIILKPHGMSTTAWVWVSGADYSDGEPKLEQFAVRFKNKEIAEDFKSVFQKCQITIKRYLKELEQGKEETNVVEVTDNNGAEEPKYVTVSEKKDQAKHVGNVIQFTRSTASAEKEPAVALLSGFHWKLENDNRQTFSEEQNESLVSKSAGVAARQDETEAAKHVLNSGEIGDVDWCCPECNISIMAEHETCIACDAPRPKLTSKSDVPDSLGLSQKQNTDIKKVLKVWDKFKLEEGTWECPTCMVPNKEMDENCISCTTQNPNGKPNAQKLDQKQDTGSKDVSNVWDKFKLQEGSWECPTCLLPNKEVDEKCIACSSPNPNAKPSISSDQLEVTNSTNDSDLKPGVFIAPSLSQLSKGSSVFGNQNNSSSFPMFGSSSPGFPAPTFSTPSFGQSPNFASKEQADGNAVTRLSGTPSTTESSTTTSAYKPISSLFGSLSTSNEQSTTVAGTVKPSFSTPFSLGKTGELGSTPVLSFYSTPNEKFKSADKTEFFTPTGSFLSSSIAIETPLSLPLAGQSSPSKPKDKEVKTPETPSKEEDGGLQCSPLVSLKKIESVGTGEEGEEIVFCERAKLYRFVTDTKEWKERGVGELKILKKSGTHGKFRLIMRRDQVRKLCANHALIDGMMLSSMPNSDKMKIWTTTADFADEEAKKETFAVRFKSVEIMDKFSEEFKKAIKDSKQSGSVREPSDRYGNEDQSQHLKEKQGSNEEEDKNYSGSSGTEDNNVDLKLTREVLPTEDDQKKAERLLLPREFFNKVKDTKESFQKEEPKNSSTKKIASLPKPMIFEAFATSRVADIANKIDVTTSSKPVLLSPEKFQEDCSEAFTPIVQLRKVETETGEENEMSLFCEKAKLYRFDSSVREWKERGVGQLKILKKNHDGSTRILMRRDQVKKICLNHYIVPGMRLEVMKKKTLMWFTNADFSDESPKEEKFAARFQTEEIMDAFKQMFNEVVGQEDIAIAEKEVEISAASRVENIGAASVAKTVDDDLTSQSNGTKDTISLSASPTEPEKGLVVNKNLESAKVAETLPSTSSNASASKVTFSWPLGDSKPLFSFGSGSTASASKAPCQEISNDQKSKEDGATQFSWSFGSSFGSSSLFSMGVSDANDQPRNDKPSTENASTINEDIQGSGPFGCLKNKEDDVNSPFSFFSASKGPVEEKSTPSEMEKSTKGPITFDWGRKTDTPTPFATLGIEELEAAPLQEVRKDSPKAPESPDKHHAGEDCMGHVEAVVTLQRVKGCTGEENEETMFNEWVKAYRFDSEARQWKERGRGHIKILLNKRTGEYRLLMRRDQVMKIAINHFLHGNMKLEPNTSAKNSWVWFTNADFADEIAKPEKLAVRFRNEDISKKFQACFNEAIIKMKEKEGVAKEEISTSSTESVDQEKSEEDIVSVEEDDFVVTYVKKPTHVELLRAESLLLPPTFFASPTPIHFGSRKNKVAKQGIASEDRSSVEVTEGASGFGIFSNPGISFSDLTANGEKAFSGFKTQVDEQQGFKGQGSVLFQGAEKSHGDEDDVEYNMEFKPIVTLERTETKTGEEEEEAVFIERCKLYRYDSDTNQWKERGIGDIKVLVNRKQATSRIVMRRDVVFKLGANHLIQPGMKLKPKQGIETTWVWKTNADIADGVPKEETFTVKFKSAEIGRRFANVIKKSLDTLATAANISENVAGEKAVIEKAGIEKARIEKAGIEKVDVKANEIASEVPEMNFLGLEAQVSSEVAFTAPSVDLNTTEYSEAKKNEAGHMFGSSFTGLDFSQIAKDQSSSFNTEKRGGFENAGARLFGGKNEEQKENEHEAHFDPIVQLEQVETKTGEEDEKALFEEKVKMYRFCHETNQWKERGVGKLKLLLNEKTKKGRLLMRRDIVLKIAANHALVKGMQLDPMKMATRTLMWKTMGDTSDGDATEALLAAKFRSDDHVAEFKRIFGDLVEGNEVVVEGAPEIENIEDAQPTMGSCSQAISESLQSFLD